MAVFSVEVTQCHCHQTDRENPINLAPVERALGGFVRGL